MYAIHFKYTEIKWNMGYWSIIMVTDFLSLAACKERELHISSTANDKDSNNGTINRKITNAQRLVLC